MKFFTKVAYWLAFRLRIYLLWSKVYRWLYHRKYRTLQFPVSLTPEQATEEMKHLVWRKDGFKELWDAIGSPHWVQHTLAQIECGGQPPGAMDCDEFAVWAATVIAPNYQPVVLNVMWRDEKGTRGHNVCLYHSSGFLYHTGNWGKLGPYGTLQNLVEILFNLVQGQGYVVGWALYSPDLKLVKMGYGLPGAQENV